MPIQSLLSPNPGSREMMAASTRSAAVECYVRHRELQGLGNWWLYTLPGADALNNKSIEEANHLVILSIWIGTSLKRLFISPCYCSGYCWEIFLGAKDWRKRLTTPALQEFDKGTYREKQCFGQQQDCKSLLPKGNGARYITAKWPMLTQVACSQVAKANTGGW